MKDCIPRKIWQAIVAQAVRQDDIRAATIVYPHPGRADELL